MGCWLMIWLSLFTSRRGGSKSEEGEKRVNCEGKESEL